MPIDPDFMSKIKKGTEHKGHAVWGEERPPEKLGIHGSKVAIDQDICDGTGTCLDVCPVNVFELADSPGHPVSNKKSDPVREAECILCMACESQCPVKAIKITV